MRATELFKTSRYDERYGEADPWDGSFITGPNGQRPGSPVALGKWLKAEQRRPRNGWWLDGEKDRDSVTWWRLERRDTQQIVTEGADAPGHGQASLCD